VLRPPGTYTFLSSVVASSSWELDTPSVTVSQAIVVTSHEDESSRHRTSTSHMFPRLVYPVGDPDAVRILLRLVYDIPLPAELRHKGWVARRERTRSRCNAGDRIVPAWN
jgi:hypothetical protein